MWQVMRIYGIRGRVLKGIMRFYDEGRACVRVGNMVSERERTWDWADKF